MGFIRHNIFYVEDSTFTGEVFSENKKLLIIQSQIETENENVNLFLDKILAAVKCSRSDDTWIFETDSSCTKSIATIRRSYPADIVIVFGIEAKQLGVFAQINKYVPFQLGTTTYLFCDPLSEIEKHKPLKVALWDTLKYTVK